MLIKEDVFDGEELVICEVSNVTIVGDNSTLLVNPRYANVICFRKCSNIKLIGLTLGHTPYKGSCSGSVLHFDSCNNIQMDALELFGCGTYGIELENCTNIRVNGSKIFECTYGALSIISSNLEFSNSMIYDCNEIAGCLVEATDSQLDFNNVSIFNNYIDNYLISLDSSTMFCEGVCVFANAFAGLCNQKITHGIYVEHNIIRNEDEFDITISSLSPTKKDIYDIIKNHICGYGKIKEAIYEDGNVYITAVLSKYEYVAQMESFIKKYTDIVMSCG